MAISLDSATRLSTDLVRVMKLFQSMRQHAPKLHPGVEPASYPILFNLLDGPRRVSLLADCVHSDVSTVSRQVTMLVSHGLLEKVADTHDGRAFMVSLSAEGVDLVERLKVSRGEWFRKMLQDWEPGEAEAFGAYLERFATAFEASKDEIRSMTLSPTLAPTIPPVLTPTIPPVLTPTLAPVLTPTLESTLPPGLAPVTTVIPPVTPSGQVLAGTANEEH